VRQGHYGYDAPYALVMFAGLAAASGIAAAAAWLQGAGRTGTLMAMYFLFFGVNATSFFYTTRRGKFIEWDRILDTLTLRGHESVLDMGCGRGAVLTAIGKRLDTGRVTGIDIWSSRDQSGNASAVTLRNASLDGVADRVQIVTGDMRALPFRDATFDLVVSSLAIHNIRSNADRGRAPSRLESGVKRAARRVPATRATALALVRYTGDSAHAEGVRAARRPSTWTRQPRVSADAHTPRYAAPDLAAGLSGARRRYLIH
jgi:arsenite methyltransferase